MGKQQNGESAAALKIFGAQVALFRGRIGLTQAELGERLGYSKSQIESVEQGRRVPQSDFINRAEEVLEAGGVLRAAAPHLAQARYPTWFQDFARLESEALSLQSYETHAIPGLMQTEAYVRALISARCPPLDDEDIETRVAARLDRQCLLTRKPPPVIGFVIEEVVLRRPIGGRETLRGQLWRLMECANLRNVSLQVMPTWRETHTGLDGPLVLLETPERRSLAYVEGQSGSFLLSERNEVGTLMQRYGIIRAQALSPEDSATLIEQVAGEL